MKPIFNILSCIVFFFTAAVAQAQTIKSSKSWPNYAAQAESEQKAEFAELEDEIDDLEDLASETNAADYVEDYDSADSTNSRTGSKKIVRKVIRKSPKTSSVSTALPDLPTQKPTLFHFTPLVGASYFTMTGNLLKNSFVNKVEHQVGFAAGILAEFRKNRSIFGLESGFMYVQAGTQGDKNTAQSTAIAGERLNYLFNEYIYVPLNVKLYPLRFNSFEMYLKAGVLAGFLMTSDMESSTLNNIPVQRDTSSHFKSNDFQGNVGLGGRGRISRDFSIGFEVTYHRGFTDVSDTLTPVVPTTLTASSTSNLGNDAYNTGFMAVLGLVIDL